MWVGKKWNYLNIRGKHLASGVYYYYINYYEVVSYEKLRTKIGELWTFKVHWINEVLEQSGENTVIGTGEADFWISPKTKTWVKYNTSWENKGVLLSFKPGPVDATNVAKSAEMEESYQGVDDPVEDSLMKLRKLLDKGLIAADEAELWRRELLGLPVNDD